MAKGLDLAVIGCGAIAHYVAEQMAADVGIRIVGVIARPGSRAKAAGMLGDGGSVVDHVSDLPADVDLIADCAGHSGLAEHGPGALRAGIDVVSLSNGALADPALAVELEDSAKAGQARLTLLSGAIGGIDVLGAGQVGGLTSVTYVGRKPPAGWRGTPAETICDLASLAEPFTHFRGTAREAALNYPKNANVAATVALAGLGLDETMVELIADPAAGRNIHEVAAEGAFGCFRLQVEGRPLPTNPKSSALAAMSMVRYLRQRRCYIQL